MPLVGFKPTISAGKWLKTYTLDRAATGLAYQPLYTQKNILVTNEKKAK